MAQIYLTCSRHGTVPYFRRRVPDDLLKVIGKRYLISSLGPYSRGVAVIRARSLAAIADHVFYTLRTMPEDHIAQLNHLLNKPVAELADAGAGEIKEVADQNQAQQETRSKSPARSCLATLLELKKREIEREEQHQQEAIAVLPFRPHYKTL